MRTKRAAIFKISGNTSRSEKAGLDNGRLEAETEYIDMLEKKDIKGIVVTYGDQLSIF
jgi:hypothetical protein